MNSEFFDSLGFYVYAYVETEPELSTFKYAYIGMGQGSRVIDHMSEDKETEHPDFHEYLESQKDPKDSIVILASNLETKRTAEALEHYLIQEYNPRLNRSPGNVRGADVATRNLKEAYATWEKDQWTTKGQMLDLIDRYGIRIATDINDTRKSNSSIKFFTPTKNGVNRWISFEKIGVVIGFTVNSSVGMQPVEDTLLEISKYDPKFNPSMFVCKESTTSTTYNHWICTLPAKSDEERSFMEYIFLNQ